VLTGIMLLSFVLVQSMPGDPLSMLIPPELLGGASEEFIAAQRERYGLDDAIIVQFFHWVGEVFQGNLGYSFHHSRPVTDILRERAVPTLVLMGGSMFVALLLAVPTGLVAATQRNRALDTAASAMGMSVIAIPSFFTSLIAIYIFGVKLRWLPAGGMGQDGFFDYIEHAFLPIAVLSASLFGPYMRYTRQAALEVLNEPYITAARARGVAPWLILVKHVLKNAAIPIATVTIVQIPLLVGGAIVVETMFAWPGTGQVVFKAISTRDFPVIIGFTLMVALIVVISQLILDLVIAWLDPRVRLEGVS
jgi:ABC-type dipeptide/oligopeptide/nickel transport system permease component